MGNNIEKGKRFVSAVISRLSPGGIQNWLSVLLGFFIPVFNSDPDIRCACQLFDDYLAPPE